MKGVLLAGGTAARLRPVTEVINKHLLPIYDKPMIHYPLHTLVKGGIRDILLITNAEYVDSFFRLLGSGERMGCRITYATQGQPLGTGAAILLAESFTAGEDFAVVLGDNLFTEDISPYLRCFQNQNQFRAKILVRRVRDPHRYGVVAFQRGRISDVIEKPSEPPSRYVSTGLWMLRLDVYNRLRYIPKSPRGEYEMTNVLAEYAHEGLLGFARLKRKWLDVGSFESLHEAAVMIRRVGRRHSNVTISQTVSPANRPSTAKLEVAADALEA